MNIQSNKFNIFVNKDTFFVFDVHDANKVMKFRNCKATRYNIEIHNDVPVDVLYDGHMRLFEQHTRNERYRLSADFISTSAEFKTYDDEKQLNDIIFEDFDRKDIIKVLYNKITGDENA